MPYSPLSPISEHVVEIDGEKKAKNQYLLTNNEKQGVKNNQ